MLGYMVRIRCARALLQLLQERPSIRLYVIVTNEWRPEDLDRLQANKDVFSIKRNVACHNSKDCLRWTQPPKCVVLSCSNIRKLRLNLSLH
ncbi:hypothetical protein F4781DRAFT_417693 [Annulohypoxylon bovei var. microspora]|nr:hypothetical protein F4781DRAFT_417693 [Annulohypoxylon bovei var. microspora]